MAHPDVRSGGSWLSALVQGCALSVLIRAYQLTGNGLFLNVAQRVARTFERDILDGGVRAPIGENGIFFEEVAVYPAAHRLSGSIFALLGLYDYMALCDDAQIKQLIQCSHMTIHRLLDEFDVGFWISTDLLHRHLASPAHFAFQIELLGTLATHTLCESCSRVVARWKRYQHSVGCYLRYLCATRCSSFGSALLLRMRSMLFPCAQTSDSLRVCIPVTSFPFTGGIQTVLEGIAQVTKGLWHIEYLAQIIGPNAGNYQLHRFGTEKKAPWHFPLVWLYVLAGARKLISLLHHGAHYQVILPQDGVFTAAFAAVVGKLAGVRVVCIDHSTLTWTRSSIYHDERAASVRRKPWHRILRGMVLLTLKLYWPSLSLLALLSARLVDHFLIPGVPGDEVGEVCNALGVPPSRLTRFNSMIDIQRHTVYDAEARASMREKKGIAADAIVVAIICRLAPEKGLEVAMESISTALAVCSPEERTRVCIVIAGDGPLLKELEEDIQRRALSQTCVLWGAISTEEVISLLGISDIFLYTSIRGACFPMSVLEAMASGCAVIASTQPMSNTRLLAEGRGIAVAAGDAMQTSAALVRLINDLELCRQMGRLARNYIAVQHSPAMFKQSLLRATYWSALDALLADKGEMRAVSAGRGES
jgi:glycosyltransferase involved in cell wall biosynthesis